MTTSFPNNFDNIQDPNGSSSLSSNNHSSIHKNANDAIEAIQVKLGKNSDSNTASHDYKLSTVTGSSKAESQSNKGISNGYAPLDSNARISQDYLPTVIINSESTGTPNEIGDTTPLPSGASVTYDDTGKTVTITLSDGAKTVYGETYIKEYGNTASGNPLISTQTKTGTYNTSTHTISYTDGISVNGSTGDVNNDNSNFAYKNKDNVFSKSNTFNGDVVLKGRVSTPYLPFSISGGVLLIDGKSGHFQKVTITGTSSIIINAKNMVPGQYKIAVNKTGGTCSVTVPTSGSKATGGASTTDIIGDTSSDNSLIGFYKYTNGTLPSTLNDGVHHIVFDVQEHAVHIMYLGKSTGY